MVTVRFRVISLACLFFFLISCASHKFDQVAFDKAYNEGDWETCISMLSAKGVYDKKSVPLKNMELAVLNHYMGRYSASSAHFEDCERLMEAGDLESMSQFESFYLNILNSLNYHNQGKLEDAVVEIKKADHEKVNQGKSSNNSLWFIYSNEQALQSIRSFDEDDEESAEYKNTISKFGIPSAQVSQGTPRKPTIDDLYRSSPTAYYLGNLFRNAAGDGEGARLDKDILKTLHPTFKIPSKEENKVVLSVIAFSGGIAKREEVVYYYPPENNGIPVYMDPISITSDDGKDLNIIDMRYKFAYQKAGENETKVNRVVTVAKNVETGETQEFNCDFLEDFGEELKKNVALKARREFSKNKAKSIIGKSAIAATYMLAVVAAEVAKQQATSTFAQIAAEAVLVVAIASYGAALNKFDEGIKADIRQVRFLPACSYAGGINLSEGTYNVKVQYKNGNTLIKEEEFQDVKVSPSSLNLLESVCLN